MQHHLVNRVCVGDIITRSAAVVPNKQAIIYKNETWTYKQLDQAAQAMAGHLATLCVAGEPVAMVSANRPEVIVTYFACAKAGLIFAPMNLGLSPEGIVSCIRHSGAKVLIATPDHLATISQVDAEWMDSLIVYELRNGESKSARSASTFNYYDLLLSNEYSLDNIRIGDRDPVQLLYTSGTTSEPKGVVTSHLAVTLASLTNALCYHYDHNTVTLSVLPLYHCAALNCFSIPTALMGGTLIISDGFDGESVLEAIEKYKVTNFVFLPKMYAELLRLTEGREHQYESVKDAIYAMAPMPSAWLERIHKLFPNALVVLSSGQSEYTPAACIQREEEQWSKAESWGKATMMTQIGIMSEDGNILGPNEPGEIVYRGPLVMNGYWKDAEATEDNFTNGWYHSGDIGWMDQENTLWFTDRMKDVIKSAGENVSSVAVERCLMAHPHVLAAAVVGLPDEQWGEAVTAYVILSPGETLEEEELKRWAKTRLARYEVPKRFHWVKELPMTATGKIRKGTLRDMLKISTAYRDLDKI